MICYILDDQYGKKIYEGLSALMTDCDFPIQDNVMNPLDCIDEVIAMQPDYILLDNYFPNRIGWREEPLWEEFLKALTWKTLSSKIICISDYGERLIDLYDTRSAFYHQGKISSFVDSKDPYDIGLVLTW